VASAVARGAGPRVPLPPCSPPRRPSARPAWRCLRRL
jgi:hypothetical protein